MLDNALIKNGVKILNKIIPFNVIKRLNGSELIIPLYHSVSDQNVPHIKHISKIKNVKAFEQDLDFLLKYYHPISFDEFYNSVLNNATVRKSSFLLTFDDGLREFKDVIAPILLRKGVPAICFLTKNFIDNKELFYRHKASLLIEEIRNKHTCSTGVLKWKAVHFPNEVNLVSAVLSVNYNNRMLLDDLAELVGLSWEEYLKDKKPYLTTTDVIDLRNKGFKFGAHSVDHPRFNLIEYKSQITQTRCSVDFLRETFGIKEKLFAFPFSDKGVNGAFFKEIYKEKIVDVTFGTSGFDKSRLFFYHQQRISLEEEFNAEEILLIHSLYRLVRWS